MKLIVKQQILNSPECWIRLVGRNGQIIMTSELYSTRTNARRAARTLSKRLGVPAFDGELPL